MPSLPIRFLTRFLLLVFVLPTVVIAQTENADLFAQVFGGSPPVEPVVLSASINGFPVGQIAGESDFITVMVSAEDIVALLANRVVPDVLQQLSQGIGTGLVEPQAASLGGITVAADPALLTVDITLPAEAMTEQPFGQRSFRMRETVVEPVPFSGYMNLSSRYSGTAERSVFSGTVDPSIWVYGTVLRGSSSLYIPADGIYTEDQEAFTLNSYQLLRDFRPRQMRLTAGTVAPTPPGPFSRIALIGIDLDRTLTMNEGQDLFGKRSYRFSVSETDLYRVQVNDRVVTSERVPRGSYIIDDLNLQNGLNRVQVDTLPPVLVPWSSRLVTQGRHVYQATAGVKRDFTDEVAGSAYWLWGFRPTVTLGSITQFTTDRVGIGITSRFAGRAGISEGTVATSVGDLTGMAVTADHTVALPLLPRAPSFSLGGEFRSDSYRTIEDEEELSLAQTRVTVTAAVGYKFEDGPGFSLRTRWRQRVSDIHSTSITLSGEQSIGGNGSLSVRLGPEWEAGDIRWSGAILLRMRPGGSGQMVTTVNYNVTGGPASVGIYPQPTGGISRFNWSGQVSGFDQTPGTNESATARLRYDAYRWGVAATPVIRRDNDTGDVSLDTTLEGSTAVVWAGSTVAISRPVRGAFALFVPRETIAGYQVGIQPVAGDYKSRIGRMAGVVPDLRAYNSNLVTLDGTGLPEGLSLGATTYRFDPLVHAGYRVVVGSEATVYVTGSLVDQLNRIPGMMVGVATDQTGEEALFFSDDTGYFEIHGLTPGSYTLLLQGERRYTGTFTIPAESQGLVELGPVVVTEGVE